MCDWLRSLAGAALCAALAFLICQDGFAQTASPKASITGPKVTQIDIRGLKDVLKTNGKPRLVNFWATWCDPCREEFPDLVKLDIAYKGKIDFITVTLDDPEDISTRVPKFLGEMKAEMPTYLLSTPDENAAIAVVSKDWSGNLPLTILYNPDGGIAYFRNGKIRYETIVAEIDKLVAPPAKAPVSQ
jgi:thiol-disulfide isomerase/thioredoxin